MFPPRVFKVSIKTIILIIVVFQTSLDANSVEVVVVSFGCEKGAAHWLQETGCKYDLLLDPDRKVRGHTAIMSSYTFVLMAS